MYCVYSGTEIDEFESNIDHIFPLSLGGRNDFTIRVSKIQNSRVNSEIDQKLAGCFFLARYRRLHNSKGHRNNQLLPRNTKISVGQDKSIVFKFNNKNYLQLYSHIKKQFITAEEIKSNG